jgi:glycerol kinase
VRPSSGVRRTTPSARAPVKIAGIAGDQQAAPSGKGVDAGSAKNFYRTGCFCSGTRAIAVESHAGQSSRLPAT